MVVHPVEQEVSTGENLKEPNATYPSTSGFLIMYIANNLPTLLLAGLPAAFFGLASMAA
jgi:hypothetical protein